MQKFKWKVGLQNIASKIIVKKKKKRKSVSFTQKKEGFFANKSKQIKTNLIKCKHKEDIYIIIFFFSAKQV